MNPANDPLSNHWNPWRLHLPVGDPRNHPHPWPAHGQTACCRACHTRIRWSSETPGSNSAFGRWLDTQDEHLCPAADGASRAPNVDPCSGTVFITLTTPPGGRETLKVSRVRPFTDELLPFGPRAGVWRTSLPTAQDKTPQAERILNSEFAPCYLDEDPDNTRVEGERRAHAFHNDLTPQRRLLRNIEARLTLAGFPNARTGAVGRQLYGLTLHGATDEHEVYPTDEGWGFATLSFHHAEGRYSYPGTIAPAHASARRVATAILVHLAARGALDTQALSPLRRARTRLEVWRSMQLWKYATYHARKRTARFRRGTTIRRR